MKKYSIIILLIELLAIVVFVFYPAPINSVAWKPSRVPSFTGTLERNASLRKTEVFGVGQLVGPEDVAIDENGVVYSGTEVGDIYRAFPGQALEKWLNTGGVPLGVTFDHKKNLIVCDALKGLLSISPDGEIEVLTNSVDGNKITFAKNAVVAKDGKIYFTEASSKWDKEDYLYDLLETKPNGRLLMYDPNTKKTSVLMDELFYANGIALSSDERFLVITETWRYSVKRYWLKGKKAGTSGKFLGNLPGFPGGISSNGNGRFWLTLISIRNPVLDKTHETPWLKDALSKLPEFLTPGPIPYGLVLGINERGPIEVSLHDPGGKQIKEVSSAEEHDGYLYFGTFKGDRIGRYKL